jgi:hypothetical protein
VLRTDHHRRSKLQERKAARDYNGTVTPGSGNGWMRKADVHSNNFLVECKTTTKLSYTLKLEDLKKLYYQAVIENKIPVFEVDFGDMAFVILDKNDFIANINAFSS